MPAPRNSKHPVVLCQRLVRVVVLGGRFSDALTGLDGAAPLGPVIVSPVILKDGQGLRIQGIYNGRVVEDSDTRSVVLPFLPSTGDSY